MKISILGYSGSGKSTMAKKLAQHYNINALHLDTVQFLPNWVERPYQEKKKMVKNYLDTHQDWVIDGNYSKLYQARRLEESDLIIVMLFNRFDALKRVVKRFFQYRGRTRSDMAEGCHEKLDWEFIKWVLYEGRNSQKRRQFYSIIEKNKDKTLVIKNQKEIDEFLDNLVNN